MTSGPAMAAGKALTQADTRLGACVNLGNHLETRKEGANGRALVDQDFPDIAGKGFKTVRVPANFSVHQGGAPDYAIDPAFMDRVEHVVDKARAAGLRVILDDHHFNAIMQDPAANTAQLTATWKQIAERFKGKDKGLWFELLNEPMGKLDNKNLASVLSPALAEIRKTNATRPVVVGGEYWSNISSLPTMPILDDPNIVYTFHYYLPFPFTHQGAKWADPVPPMGATFGSQADMDNLAADVKKAQAFIARTGKPLFVGETGAYESIPLAQRAPYYKAVHDAFSAAGIDQCIWAYANTFPVRDAKTGEWHEPILRALGL
ncbi:MAG: glycoside hydrolase family 5 protein [Sphingobium sp.]|nr:glycoside hydrolase family 5 protein [Sphingobium sp.]